MSDENRDEILEFAAQLIEEHSLLDLSGIWAKRKRDREDAQVRKTARHELRQQLADLIRSNKDSRKSDAVAILADLAELKDGHFDHAVALRDAWPLAWKGWVDIECVIRTNSNVVPPEMRYRIVLTDAGREILTSAQPPSNVSPSVPPMGG